MAFHHAVTGDDIRLDAAAERLRELTAGGDYAYYLDIVAFMADREPYLPQPLDVMRRVGPVPGPGPRGRLNEADLVMVMQRADAHAGQLGHTSHGQVLFHATDHAASRHVRAKRVAPGTARG